ncbi:MAG: hypothetical protein ACYSUQ_03625, partial [Planctomycetota bacterium]|jgi:hypothetical protein
VSEQQMLPDPGPATDELEHAGSEEPAGDEPSRDKIGATADAVHGGAEPEICRDRSDEPTDHEQPPAWHIEPEREREPAPVETTATPGEQLAAEASSDNGDASVSDPEDPRDSMPGESAEEGYGDRESADNAAALDLDPETACKLRVLRRLGGEGRTDAELLAQLRAQGPAEQPKGKVRKRWWKRSS